MEEQISIIDSSDLLVTHFFIYKGKQFPFNMNIFKCFSKYFYSNEHQYDLNSNIDLFDESNKDINISESNKDINNDYPTAFSTSLCSIQNCGIIVIFVSKFEYFLLHN